MRSGLRRTWGQRAVLAVNTIGIVAALSLAWALDVGEEVASSINRVELTGTLTPVDEAIDGNAPPFNVLLVGYDSAANLDPDDPIAVGRQGERLGDVIIVARIDQAAGAATMLSIPRDLWVSVPGYDDQKINSSFQLGGPSLLIETIEAELDIPINNFMSVDLAGFEGLVDVLDHVNLYFEYPARDFNPSPLSGPPRSMSGFSIDDVGCQSLDPPNALAFVRSRNFEIFFGDEWVDDGQRSDLERIRRQQLFVESFFARAIDLGARNPLVLRELVTAAVPHLTIDQGLTPQALIDIARAFDSFDPEMLETYSLPTEFGFERNRSVSVVRTLEDEARPVVRLLQGAPASDPSTVGITVRTVADEQDAADDIAVGLADANFDIDATQAVAPPVGVEVPFGVTVAYGRDGDTALVIVMEALAGLGVSIDATVLDVSLPGREMVVSFGGAAPEVTPEPTSTVPEPTSTAPEPAPDSVTTVPPTTSTTVATPTPSATEPAVAAGEPSSPTVAGPSVRLCP